MEDRIYSDSELASIIAIGLDQTSLSGWPMVKPPFNAAELVDLRNSGHADERDLLQFAGPRRGIRTTWGYVTAETGEDNDLSSLKIRLESDPWYSDSSSVEANGDGFEPGIYLSDIAKFNLGPAIGDDLTALAEVGAIWTDVDSVFVIGEFYMRNPSLEQVAAILADVFRRVDVAALVGKAVLEAADGGVEA